MSFDILERLGESQVFFMALKNIHKKEKYGRFFCCNTIVIL